MSVIFDGFSRFNLSEQQVSVYANPAFSAEQMREILRGYAADLSDTQVTAYANAELQSDQMQEIREALESDAGLTPEQIELQAAFI